MVEIDSNNKNYPKRLLKIEDAPQKLYVEGNVELLKSTGIAVIGSRSHSDYGERMCIRFVQDLVQYGVTIISGLAKGIDAIGHKTCIENGGKTIMVLPCGFNNIFPPENKKLFKDIINLGGIAVTEYPPNEKADTNYFLKRNRIVAGLAIATLVIEAGNRSGTSVTARITMEQGKKVFCVPSSLENTKGITSNEIIQKGGKLVTCAEDVLQEFKDIKFEKKEKKLSLQTQIDKEYLAVYDILNDKPQHINEIARRLKSTIQEVSYKLMMLEVDGYIKQLPGKNFIRR